MGFPKKYNTLIINALLAVVVCMVINFSYLLAVREQDRREYEATQWLREVESMPSKTGVLRIHKDGYGYVLVEVPQDNEDNDNEDGNAVADTLAADSPADTLADPLADPDTDSLVVPAPVYDSIHVGSRDIGRLSLDDGDTLRVVTGGARRPGANPVVIRVMEVNGDPFDYGERFDHPSDVMVMGMQVAYYLLLAFILLTVMTAGAARNASVRFYLARSVYCVSIAVAMWFLMPVMRPRSGEIAIMAMNMRGGVFPFDIMIMKCAFVVVVALFYGRTYQLIWQREGIMIENERLKSENLRSRYNTLVGQINPHFLFNSLNSLSALVREDKNDDAVRYIDRLSDTFRYTIRNEANATTTLGEELEFVSAYKYLLEVRYAGKLFIDIDVDAGKLGWSLPTFSVQPLIENAVKHNVITRARPLRVSIRTEGNRLVVSNPINPKLEPENGTGIGLANLDHRWRLLTGHGIDVRNDGATFSVSLPFGDGGELNDVL
ncbi:MAG: histidine kinase [Alistipes sp.]|jgi:hypothetical protein|nr:histidine kinase [Alistipes sp.]